MIDYIIYTILTLQAALLAYGGYILYDLKVSIPRHQKRIDEVYKIRLYILHNYPLNKYLSMPTFDEMLYSDVPLHIENYI